MKHATKMILRHQNSAGLAGVSSGVGLDDGLLVYTLLLLLWPKLKLIMSVGRAFTSPATSTSTTTTKTTPYPKGLGLDSPWVLSGAAVLVGCWLPVVAVVVAAVGCCCCCCCFWWCFSPCCWQWSFCLWR